VSSREEVAKRLQIMLEMYKKAKELDYKPSMYWYLAKVEALAWVLGKSQLEIRVETVERDLLEAES